ncbi:hypothetical protein N0V85_008902 [Neurospora sp. IMI 360204]|nr:hypothetical protein N0V85_008902 [Neurospora sp. IMI 360204]
MTAPVPRGSSYSDSYSHESCPTSPCDSCFGYIYDNGYDDSITEELDDEDDEEGLDGWDQSQSPASACQSHVTDPFSMSSMSSLFGSSSSPSSQQPQCSFGAPRAPPPVLLSSRGKGPRSAQRCSCQKTSKAFCNIFASGPPSGNNGRQNQYQNTATETQLSVFSSNGQSQTAPGIGVDNQTPTQTDSQALGHLLGGGLGGANIKGRNGNGNGMIKNLNVYNPNITIQVTPENFNKFIKFFVQKSGNGNGN